MLNGKTLKADSDYTVGYKDNKDAGTATVVVTGTGNYKDSAKATFTIEGAPAPTPTPTTKTSIAKAKISTVGNTGKKTMKVSWKKVTGAKKYQMQYRQVGGKWKTATVKGTSKTVKGLKAGKKLYVAVRPLRSAGGKTYAGVLHGAWAKDKSGKDKTVKAQSSGTLTTQEGSLTATQL